MMGTADDYTYRTGACRDARRVGLGAAMVHDAATRHQADAERVTRTVSAYLDHVDLPGLAGAIANAADYALRDLVGPLDDRTLEQLVERVAAIVLVAIRPTPGDRP